MPGEATGTCEHCKRGFSYAIYHNGFGDTAFGYCSTCGCLASLSCWCSYIPEDVKLKVHGPIDADVEPFLRACSCGGRFTARAKPRCPHCHDELSAEHARAWIEANAPGTAKGWSWQNSWSGMYSIVIENNHVTDPWSRVG